MRDIIAKALCVKKSKVKKFKEEYHIVIGKLPAKETSGDYSEVKYRMQSKFKEELVTANSAFNEKFELYDCHIHYCDQSFKVTVVIKEKSLNDLVKNINSFTHNFQVVEMIDMKIKRLQESAWTNASAKTTDALNYYNIEDPR